MKLPAKNYLETMGNAVADMLHPLGIDVDVDIEHNGERTKCSGAQNTAPQQPVPQPTEPTKDQPTSSAHASQTKSDKEDQGIPPGRPFKIILEKFCSYYLTSIAFDFFVCNFELLHVSTIISYTTVHDESVPRDCAACCC